MPQMSIRLGVLPIIPSTMTSREFKALLPDDDKEMYTFNSSSEGCSAEKVSIHDIVVKEKTVYIVLDGSEPEDTRYNDEWKEEILAEIDKYEMLYKIEKSLEQAEQMNTPIEKGSSPFSDTQSEIYFTPALYRDLMTSYNAAINIGASSFIFLNREFHTEYTKYLLEYLQVKFRG